MSEPQKEETKRIKLQLQYFKESGKFYSEGEIETELPYNSKGQIAIMYQICSIVRQWSEEQKLPGVVSDWLKGGFIHINCEEGYPCLLVPESEI